MRAGPGGGGINVDQSFFHYLDSFMIEICNRDDLLLPRSPAARPWGLQAPRRRQAATLAAAWRRGALSSGGSHAVRVVGHGDAGHPRRRGGTHLMHVIEQLATACATA